MSPVRAAGFIRRGWLPVVPARHKCRGSGRSGTPNTDAQGWGVRALLVLIICWCAGCEPANEVYPQQVIVLGFDGLDPTLCSEMMEAGLLPNLSKLAAIGSYHMLETSTPPQSPVAWSNLITGTDSGQHGVFDFVHRDPVTALPFSFAATTEAPNPLPLVGNRLDSISMFGYEIPVRSPKLEINRHAPAFWEYLTEAGIPTHIFRMPANYPPTASSGAHFCCLSDMGTVDLVESLGTFSYYTEDPGEWDNRMSQGGGRLYQMEVSNHRAKGRFVGPTNTFKAQKGRPGPGSSSAETADVEFEVYRDPESPVATVEYGGRTVVLKEGEWSEWQPIEFEMIRHVLSLKAICRFYLKQVHPYVKLYVTPFNFDPQEEMWEIDQPADWSVRVSDAVGRYYTQGLPEETKALSNKVLTRDEFLAQADLVYKERLKLLGFALDHYQGGLLFFYFGTSDQIGHMFWGAREPDHPAITPAEHEKYRGLMEEVYARLDGVVARVTERFPRATLLVMSDHGFCSYRRTFNLNTWLKENGYAAMQNPFRPSAAFNFAFSRTRAYGLGINGLYINLQGRERSGIVQAGEKQALMDEIVAKLKAYRDPETGAQVVIEVYQCDRIYSGPKVAVGPDLVVGYASGYRGGGGSALGGFRKAIVEDNTDAWCGDHCVATHVVPGVLYSNRRVEVADPTLLDIAPTLLNLFGLVPPEQMRGRDIFSATVANGRPSRPR